MKSLLGFVYMINDLGIILNHLTELVNLTVALQILDSSVL